MTAPADSTAAFRTVTLGSGLTARACDPTEPRHEPLLLLHGIAGGSWYWERWQRWLANAGWPSLALDLRGRAGSRPVADLGRVTLEDYVADAREAAAHLGTPAVVGHSMGGLLAQKLAEAGEVRAAVLLCAMPPKGIGFATAGLAARQVKHLWPMLAGRPLESRGDVEALTLNRMPAGERASLAARFVADSGTVARQLSLGGLAVARDRVRCPVVAISTAEDRFFRLRVGAEIAARYHCAHWIYDGHAHFVPMEPGWERIVADVARWLAHVLAIPQQEAAYAALWTTLKASIGETRPLTFFDGRRVEAEIVNVDLARHQDVIYEPRRVLDPGPGAMRQPPLDEPTRVWVGELRAGA